MTLQELSKYYCLNQLLERDREMLSSLYAAAGPGAQALTGMPHASGVTDKVGGLSVEIAELKKHIAKLEEECWQELKKLERFIGQIEDDRTRTIFRLRFIRCMSWIQVADTIGGRNTEEGVKKFCYRKLREMQKNFDE